MRLQQVAVRDTSSRADQLAVVHFACDRRKTLVLGHLTGAALKQHHEPIDTWPHATASTHARGHAPAQARAEEAERLRARAKLAEFLERSPDTATAKELQLFKLHLVDQGTSPITLNRNVTFAGLKFFFVVTLGRGELMAKTSSVQRVPQTLPVVLSREEVARLIGAVT